MATQWAFTYVSVVNFEHVNADWEWLWVWFMSMSIISFKFIVFIRILGPKRYDSSSTLVNPVTFILGIHLAQRN